MPASARPRGIEASNALAQAIVDTVREPLLVLDKHLRIIVASRSFYRDFRAEPQHTQGKLLYELGNGQWDSPQLRVLLEEVTTEDRSVEAYEVARTFPDIGPRIMLLNVRSIVLDESFGGGAVLLAIEDVTDRRAIERERDDLLRQKEMLLEEMQHRISNSLQIIASILLMKARTVASEETREHLHDAHKRVLAVAAVQRHLHATAGAEPIQLEPYFTRLCVSLAGAMIPEGADAIALTVTAQDARASSDVSVSLGLVVTELVINALKHAFPIVKPGCAIDVTYIAVGDGWTLTVADNGVGKTEVRTPGPGGLGTSIVNALADQLGAKISQTSGARGTSVSIVKAAREPALAGVH